MKKFLISSLSLFFLVVPLQSATAQESVVNLTSTLHQNFTGEFRNDDLAQELTPSGRLGQLVFTPINNSKLWVIDPSLIDEVVAMTGDYKLATDAIPGGKEIALAWLSQLKKVSANNSVVALAYGNPDLAMAKRLAPSELRMYYKYGKIALEVALGRPVRSEPSVNFGTGASKLSPLLRKNYGENRKKLTRLSRVVNYTEITDLRMRLARLLSPALEAESMAYFSYSARSAVDAQVSKLRINPGKYQITTESSKLPVTVVNEFPVEVNVNIDMVTMNGRISVDSFRNVKLAPESKLQLDLKAFVVAPGKTTVLAKIVDSDSAEIVPATVLALNATVIDSRLAWLTTGAAILLLLAVISQSVRRVRKGVRTNEI